MLRPFARTTHPPSLPYSQSLMIHLFDPRLGPDRGHRAAAELDVENCVRAHPQRTDEDNESDPTPPAAETSTRRKRSSAPPLSRAPREDQAEEREAQHRARSDLQGGGGGGGALALISANRPRRAEAMIAAAAKYLNPKATVRGRARRAAP